MIPGLILSLEISAIGMGLVFGAILLLWGVMALLVRLTRQPAPDSGTPDSTDQNLKQRAAIAAITIALAQELDNEPHAFPLPPTAVVSAWQTVMRTKILNKRGTIR